MSGQRVFAFVPFWNGVRLEGKCPAVVADNVEQAVDRWCDLLSHVGADGAPDRFDILDVGRKDARKREGVARSKPVKVGELVVDFEGHRTVH